VDFHHMDNVAPVVGGAQNGAYDGGFRYAPEFFERDCAVGFGPEGYDRSDSGDPCLQGGSMTSFDGDGGVVARRVERAGPIESGREPFEAQMPAGGGLTLELPLTGFQTRRDFAL
jgi:hypothetical protein